MEEHRALSDKRKERTKRQTVKPTNLQDGHCQSSASLLGTETTRMWRAVPRGEGTAVWLCFHCPFPLF